jgi:hypothetical protein
VSGRVFYRAEGQALARVKEFQERTQEAHSKAWEIGKRVGAEELGRYSNPYRVFGYTFKDGPPKGWKLSAYDSYMPRRNSKEGKALDAEIRGIVGPSLEPLLGAPGLMFVGNRILFCTLETFGDVVVIGVPTNDESKPFFTPQDAVELRHSEYWALKEAHATPEATA